MIRELEDGKGLDGPAEERMIRRKFIPAEVIVDEEGDFKYFRIKLSPAVVKIAGVLMTRDSDQFISQPTGPMWYAGPGDPRGDNPVSPLFISTLPAVEIKDDFYQFNFNLKKGQWLYFAMPVHMDSFTFHASEFPMWHIDNIVMRGVDDQEEYAVYAGHGVTGPVTLTIEAKGI